MEAKTCVECQEVFKTSNGSDKCYDCNLEEITDGLPPEEGDFNTAAIRSGTMSAQERRWLQQDLESVEVQEDPWEEEYYDDDDWYDDFWEGNCPDCDHPYQYCICS